MFHLYFSDSRSNQWPISKQCPKCRRYCKLTKKTCKGCNISLNHIEKYWPGQVLRNTVGASVLDSFIISTETKETMLSQILLTNQIPTNLLRLGVH